MLVSIMETAVVICYVLGLLHVLTMTTVTSHPTRHRKPHLNDTTTARSPYQLPTYQNQDSHSIHYYMTHACEREELHLSCDDDYVLLIVRANYGRHSTRPCTKTTKKRHTMCPGTFVHPKKVLARACTGSRSCKVSVISRLFGDPCPKVSKYLEVYFGCVKEEQPSNEDS